MKSLIVGSAAAVALSLAVFAPQQAAAAQGYECPRIHTTGKYAYTWCRVYSGQVRLRADCNGAPDKYSEWIRPIAGNPTQRLQAGSCVFGVGGASSIEWRP
ncbi:hypothetical protein SAMN05421504_11293 [Amycolatopsis xylanica]|uniref:Alpha amylase inhibitor n=1 Tax=Amycolatopsis xylanica TaxID=589385 RepID=A0A1H3RZI0_9PSEU|nr:hypothetical protein [Amycolatopsis xylanica]SDZ30641.1 hypothetical protein SAMN05421504_11293 [Amycolatopsis xylanica]